MARQYCIHLYSTLSFLKYKIQNETKHVWSHLGAGPLERDLTSTQYEAVHLNTAVQP